MSDVNRREPILDEEQRMLRDSAVDYLDRNAGVELARRLRDRGQPHGHSKRLWGGMVEMGWTGALVPEAYGGFELGHAGMGQVSEQAGRTLAASPLFSSSIVCTSVVSTIATSPQKEKLLPQLADGSLTLALAVDETPRHAPTRISTACEEVSDGYRINGVKRFVLDGNSADKIIVVARDTAVERGNGYALVLTDCDSPGVSIEPAFSVDSRDVATIHFDDVVVGSDARLGPHTDSGSELDRVFDIANAHLAAELLGIATACFDRTLQYLKDRRQFGVAIGSFQALQHRAAIMWMELELCRSVVLEALQTLDCASAPSATASSIAKAKACRVTELVTNEAIQMHGGIGMTDEHDVGFFLKRARVAQALFGDHRFHTDRFARQAGY